MKRLKTSAVQQDDNSSPNIQHNGHKRKTKKAVMSCNPDVTYTGTLILLLL